MDSMDKFRFQPDNVYLCLQLQDRIVLACVMKLLWYFGNYMQIHVAVFLVNRNLALSVIQASLQVVEH